MFASILNYMSFCFCTLATTIKSVWLPVLPPGVRRIPLLDWTQVQLLTLSNDKSIRLHLHHLQLWRKTTPFSFSKTMQLSLHYLRGAMLAVGIALSKVRVHIRWSHSQAIAGTGFEGAGGTRPVSLRNWQLTIRYPLLLSITSNQLFSNMLSAPQ